VNAASRIAAGDARRPPGPKAGTAPCGRFQSRVPTLPVPEQV